MGRPKKSAAEKLAEQAARDAASRVMADMPEFGFVPDGADGVPQDVMELVSQVGGEPTKLTLFKRDKTGKNAYVASYEVGEFNLESVKQDFGGGRYLMRVYFLDDDGVSKNRSIVFHIDESVKPTPADQRTNSRDDFTTRMMERMFDKADRQPDSAKDIALALATAMSTSMQATMAMMMPLLERMGKGGGSNVSELLGVMEFGIDHFGGGAKDDGWMAIAREGIPLIRGLAANLPGARPATAAPAPAHPEAAAVPPANAGNQNPWPLVRERFRLLIPYIQQDADPEQVAMLLDNHEPRLARWLEKQVILPNFRAELMQNVPEVANFMPWVDRLLAEFLPDDGVTDAEIADEPDE